MADDIYGLLQSGLPPEVAAQARGLSREQAIADALSKQAMTPLGGARSAGRYMVAPSMFEGLAKLGQAYVGKQMGDETNAKMAGLIGSNQARVADALAGYAKTAYGTPAVPAEVMPEGVAGPARPEQPAVPGDMNKAIADALASNLPAAQRYSTILAQQQTQKNAADIAARQHAADIAARAEQRQFDIAAQGQNRLDAIEAQAREGRISRAEADARAADLRRELQAQAEAARREMRGMVASSRQPQVIQGESGPMVLGPGNVATPVVDSAGNPVKPARSGKNGNGQLPTQALKLRQEELDAIGTGASINADLGALEKQIDEGKLSPSLMNNAAAWVRNNTNNSTEQSRNLGSYQATLEKLRNDSLRLNKGVQTEGDATRAWNELMGNSRDTAFVKQRLGEIQRINERAVNLRKMNVDTIHSNYGLDPMDVSGYKNQPAAVGSTSSQGAFGAPPAGAVREKK